MLTFTAASTGAALMVGGWLFQDPGTPKNGRILIDDFHSGRWEKSTVRMGKYDFGGEPVYSYSSLVYWLEHYLPEITVNEEGPLDQLDLARAALGGRAHVAPGVLEGLTPQETPKARARLAHEFGELAHTLPVSRGF